MPSPACRILNKRVVDTLSQARFWPFVSRRFGPKLVLLTSAAPRVDRVPPGPYSAESKVDTFPALTRCTLLHSLPAAMPSPVHLYRRIDRRAPLPPGDDGTTPVLVETALNPNRRNSEGASPMSPWSCRVATAPPSNGTPPSGGERGGSGVGGDFFGVAAISLVFLCAAFRSPFCCSAVSSVRQMV